MSELLIDEISTQDGALGLITLNRPQALNALSYPIIKGMHDALNKWEADPNIQAVIISGSGSRAFCAGGDIRAIYELGINDYQSALPFFQDEYKLNYRIKQYPKCYIALLHGVSMGGGLGISLHGQFRLASENLKLAMPETGIGLHPDIGASYFLSKCSDNLGLYLALTGKVLNISDALFSGLIDSALPYEKFQDFIEALTLKKLSKDITNTISTTIKQFAITPTIPSELQRNLAIINECFDVTSLEKLFKNLDAKTEPFAKETLKILLSRSPTSLSLTFQQLLKAKNLDLKQCLAYEYQLTTFFLQHPDLYEGIRAAIVDKTQDPNWTPNNIQEINPEDLNKKLSQLPLLEI